jgi:Tol biopolymer transport system component
MTRRHLTWLVNLCCLTTFLGTDACWSGAFEDELRGASGQIIYESRRDGNWDLFTCRADGSQNVNLTRTPDSNEMYPHVSPDGSRICFLVDEGAEADKSRNVYYMNRDGSGRTLVARNGRDPCWSPDGKRIAYLPGEFAEFTLKDFASRGLMIYDLASGKATPHPNDQLHHLYNLCWSADGNWFVATVHGGMGFQHAIIAFEAAGTRVQNLDIPGCRPDLSTDGRHVAWGASDFVLRTAEIDWSGPKIVGARDLISSKKPIEVYHVDWSPDGKFITFSRGPARKNLGPAPEMIGATAESWDICVATTAEPDRLIQITHDGQSNKEPDWMPALPPAQ